MKFCIHVVIALLLMSPILLAPFGTHQSGVAHAATCFDEDGNEFECTEEEAREMREAVEADPTRPPIGPDGRPLITREGDRQFAALQNYLNFGSVEDLLLALLSILIQIAWPIIVFFVIFAGFTYVTAQGDESKITKAHSMLLWSVIGGLVILGAQVIFAVIKGTIESFGV